MKHLRIPVILFALFPGSAAHAYFPPDQMIEIAPVGPYDLWDILRQYVALHPPLRVG